MVVLTRLGPPEDGIQHAEAATTVYVNDKSLGAGKLYISEARVSWVGEQEQGFSLEYPHIAMHAIHKNAAEFPRPNLYLIIDVRLVDSDGTPTPESSHHGSDDEGDGDDGDKDPGITEIRCVMFFSSSTLDYMTPVRPKDSEENLLQKMDDLTISIVQELLIRYCLSYCM